MNNKEQTMKKSELKEVIREEVKLINEKSWQGQIEKANATIKKIGRWAQDAGDRWPDDQMIPDDKENLKRLNKELDRIFKILKKSEVWLPKNWNG